MAERGIPIRSISRSIAVLQAVNRAGAMSMGDIALAAGVPYPTACRIVQTLAHEGLLVRDKAKRRYHPTSLVQTLSHGYQSEDRLVDIARPHIVALTKKVGWPISLTTHVGQRMMIRDSTHELTTLTFHNYHRGYALPILESASGQAHIAFAPDDERRTILNTLSMVPDNKANNALAMFESGALTAEIRAQGYATREHNRHTENPGKTSSIAAPIIRGDRPAGVLTLIFFASAITMREAVTRYADDLKATAKAIADELDG